MKRFFICAAAAIVALASCSKTEVVNTSVPEEIGFKAVTGVMTKTTTFDDDIELGVFANLTGDNDADGAEYFDNTLFAKGNGSTWTAEGKYWPLQSALNFTVYAPFVQGATYEDNVLTIPVADNSTAQIDWLYGAARYLGKEKGSEVATALNHGLSKVTVKVYADKANVYTLTGVQLDATYQAGTLEITYDDNVPSVDAQLPEDDAYETEDMNYITDATPITAIANTEQSPAQPLGSVYVFPSDQTSFTVSYKIAGAGNNVLTAPITLDGTWDPGKHYTYVLKFTANQIEFSKPTINIWENQDEVERDPQAATEPQAPSQGA